MINNSDVTSVKSQLARPDHYTGSGGSGTPANTGDVQNVSSMPAAYTTVQGLEDLVNTLASLSGAIQNGSGTSSSNWELLLARRLMYLMGTVILGMVQAQVSSSSGATSAQTAIGPSTDSFLSLGLVVRASAEVGTVTLTPGSLSPRHEIQWAARCAAP